MEGLLSLTKKTTPSNYYYICEKKGGSLCDKVMYPHSIVCSLLMAGCLLKLIPHSSLKF
jgi:hypothetical protein